MRLRCRLPGAHAPAGWGVVNAASDSPVGTIQETTSMLDQPFAGAAPATIEARASRRHDRAMSILQYGTAFLAIAGAVLLGSVR